MGRKASGRTGIQQVADAAGVSPTTVSHAMNGKGRISEETRTRVIEAAKELGYEPNRNAQRMVSGGSGLIAFAFGSNPAREDAAIEYLPDFMYLANTAVAASNAAASAGLGLLLAASPSQFEEDGPEIEAALIVDPIEDEPFARVMRARDVPFVTLGRIPGATEVENPYWVDSDHESATRRSLDHLKDQGGQAITLITAPPTASYAVDSIEAYREWCGQNDQDESILVIEGNPFDESTRAGVMTMLKASKPPYGVLCLLHPLARVISETARQFKIKIPEELMIASISNDRWINGDADFLHTITGTDLHPEELSREAISILHKLISGRVPEEPRRIVDSELIIQRSTERR